jgi:5,10-methylenetetrahydromethanopterin reductase
MRIGVFIVNIVGGPTSIADLLAHARDAEERGFATAWIPQLPWGLDALTSAALVGTATSKIEIATGVVPTIPRHPLTMAVAALTARAASNNRFTLGIGPSHPILIENMYGLSYAKAASHTGEYVQILKAAAKGKVDFEGEHFKVHFTANVPGADGLPVLVAALGPKMLKLTGTYADGTATLWADEQALESHVVPLITAAANQAGRPAPRIVASLPVVVTDDAGAAKTEIAPLFTMYEMLPAYQQIMGKSASEKTIDLAVVGNEGEVTKRLQRLANAGATDFCATVVGVGSDPAASRNRTFDLLASLNG